MKPDKTLALLGMAKRAGALILGEKQVLLSLKNAKNPVVFLANDAGANIKRKIENKTHTIDMFLCETYSMNELSEAIGTQRSAIVLVNDRGFNENFKKRLTS